METLKSIGVIAIVLLVVYGYIDQYSKDRRESIDDAGWRVYLAMDDKYGELHDSVLEMKSEIQNYCDWLSGYTSYEVADYCSEPAEIPIADSSLEIIDRDANGIDDLLERLTSAANSEYNALLDDANGISSEMDSICNWVDSNLDSTLLGDCYAFEGTYPSQNFNSSPFHPSDYRHYFN